MPLHLQYKKKKTIKRGRQKTIKRDRQKAGRDFFIYDQT